MDLIVKPVRVATSRRARQTYLNTFIFMIASAILLGLAVIAYILFYLEYIPQIGIERVIHLQYGDGLHPYGIASLDSSLIHDQAYDISLSLHVPRSPSNLAAGNFMLSLSLLSPNYTPPARLSLEPIPLSFSSIIPASSVLFTSRRPALIPYSSRLVSLSSRLVALPLYILRLKTESETLSIPMAESATFQRGHKSIPATVVLELEANHEVQVYDTRINFTARFSGLRWLMYNYRILSFVGFTTAFWLAEVTCAVLVWALMTPATPASIGEVKEESVKREDSPGTAETDEDLDEPDLSDTPRSFPVYGRQAPLRYVPEVKYEESGADVLDKNAVPPFHDDGDDEDEEGEDKKIALVGASGGRTDSGIGTSYSEGGGSVGISRRKSRGGRSGD